MIKKIKAVMIGHAVGDALGVPVEFCERSKLDEDPVTNMRGFGSYDVPAGAWSDDTSMSLCTLAVLASGKLDYFEIMVNFVKWLENGEYTPTGETFDVGRTCLRSILRFVGNCYSDETKEFVKPDNFDPTAFGGTGEHSNGNGSLMRIHPFVLYAYAKASPFFDWVKIIETASALTHAHRCSQIGCFIYTIVLLSLLKEPSKESVFKGLTFAEEILSDQPEFSRYNRIFKDDFTSLPREEIKSTGYVVDTLEAALWCVLTTSDYESAVLKAVNLGRDADTVAAVTGSLAGALYGYDAIPQEWKDTLLKRDYIETLCETACENWLE